MYRRTFLFLVFCSLFIVSFTACDNGTNENPNENIWIPSRYVGTYEHTTGNYQIIWDNSGFTLFKKEANVWKNNRKGWSEINYAGTKLRFTYTDLWSNDTWQSFTYSEEYHYSYSGDFVFSGDGYDDIMEGTWVRKVAAIKPAQLASTATYQETVNKLDEVITYCNNNPGPGNANDSLKLAAESKKTQIALLQSTWSSVSTIHISTINTSIIAQLQ
jgi:hypothetical protein